VSGWNITTKPIRLIVAVSYSTDGVLQAVSVALEFGDGLIEYAPCESATPGDLFDVAFAKVCAQALTLVRTPVSEAPEVRP